MKQQQQDDNECYLNSEPDQEFIGVLRQKFQQMTNLQLRKQKIAMIKDLQKINGLLDNAIRQQQYQCQSITCQQLDRQIQRNKKLQNSLTKNLSDFQFMLTGDYSVKADEEIAKLSQKLKISRQQINKFRRMLSVPMQKDIQICDDLQKQLYRIQQQLEQGKLKIIKKKEEINKLAIKNLQKIQNIKKLTVSIQSSGNHLEEKNEVNNQNNTRLYQQLNQKKKKLISIIQKDQKRYTTAYKLKLKKFKQIQLAFQQMPSYLQQIQKIIQEKTLQLKMKKLKIIVQVKSSKQRTSQPNLYVKNILKTQQNSQLDKLIKQRQKRHRLYSQCRQNPINNFHQNKQLPTNEGQYKSSLLPKLYKALGKQKLNIEEDCDIKDLLYY